MPGPTWAVPDMTHDAADCARALDDAAALGVTIEATPWTDVHRAWDLAQMSLRYADAIYIAAAERHHSTLVTSDRRIVRSNAAVECEILTATPGEP